MTSVTARVFTRVEQAHNHCQVGNITLYVRVRDWLAGLDERDQAMAHGRAQP